MNNRGQGGKVKKVTNALRNPTGKQFIRFCIIGVLATGIHYGLYYLLQNWINLNIAYTIGYLVSFVGNFMATCYFTFRTSPTMKKIIGFVSSHGVNYILHMTLFNMFLYIGVHRLVAPLMVISVAALMQFTILKFVFTRKEM